MSSGKSHRSSNTPPPWKKLTPKQVDLVLKNETTFLEYLATLSVEQIDSYLLLLQEDTAMEKESRDSFIALLQHVREDREEADLDAEKKIGPLVERLKRIDALDKQIAALEKIEKQL